MALTAGELPGSQTQPWRRPHQRPFLPVPFRAVSSTETGLHEPFWYREIHRGVCVSAWLRMRKAASLRPAQALHGLLNPTRSRRLPNAVCQASAVPPSFSALNPPSVLKRQAEIKMSEIARIPDGERTHVHLHGGPTSDRFASLTEWSEETEVCRLDAKGIGLLPSGPFRETAR